MENREECGGHGISMDELKKSGMSSWTIAFWITVIFIITVIVYIVMNPREHIDKNSLTSDEIQRLLVVIEDELGLQPIDIIEIDVLVEIFELGDTIRQIHTIYRDEDDELHTRLVSTYVESKNVKIE